MGRIGWTRFVVASLAAYATAVVSLTLLFGNPFIEGLLFSEDAGQSEKVLSVWFEQEPLPAVTPLWEDLGEIEERGFAVQGLLLLWAAAVVLVYALGWVNRPGSLIWRGLTFGAVMWAVTFLFFEAYVPFNLLGEPFPLVLLELSLQLVAMLVTGLVIALAYRQP